MKITPLRRSHNNKKKMIKLMFKIFCYLITVKYNENIHEKKKLYIIFLFFFSTKEKQHKKK